MVGAENPADVDGDGDVAIDDLLAVIAAWGTCTKEHRKGDTPSFEVHGLTTVPLTALPLAAIIGVIGGIGGALFNRALLVTQNAVLTQSRVPHWTMPGIAGAIVGLTAWWLPDAVGGGHIVAEHVLSGTMTATLSVLALLLVVKFIMTVISYASGAPGGIFAPMLLLGAICGAAFGKVSASFSPALAAHSQALAVMGMAAFFVGSVRAPLTGIVLISEMTGGYELLFPICIASLAAYLMAEGLRSAPIYDALLEADLKRSGHGPTRAEPNTVYIGVQSRSALAGKPIAKAGLPPGCLIVGVERSGTSLLPSAETVLLAGDHISILTPGDAPEAPLKIVRLCTGM